MIGLLALLPLFSLALMPTGAVAQQYYGSNAAPRIDGFNVDEVRRLEPGAELHFSVFGTPGGKASLRIAGAQRDFPLYEEEPGRYEGVYTISNRDTIDAQSSVSANLRVGNQVTSAVLSESLQSGGRQQAGNALKIQRFDVEPSRDLSAGNELTFTVHGTPGGKADVVIGGAKGKFFLPEVRSGEYSGTYTIKRRDRIDANSAVTATLAVGTRVTTAMLTEPLVTASAPSRRPSNKVCETCGTVEAINLVEVKGDAGYLGAIGGGVVGGLLGNQVGGGSGKKLATIAGVVGGAFAGREIEKNVKKNNHYEVLVRLQTGGTQTAVFEADPGYRIGDKVRVTDGTLVRD